MTTPAQEVDMIYANLKPGAVLEAQQYILSRTPERLQTLMIAKIDADLNPPPDPTHAVVANGQAVTVRNWDNGTGPGVAVVAGGSLTQVNATPVATKAIVPNGGPVVVVNQANTAISGSPATAAVAAGALTNVKLSV